MALHYVYPMTTFIAELRVRDLRILNSNLVEVFSREKTNPKDFFKMTKFPIYMCELFECVRPTSRSIFNGLRKRPI